MQPLPGKYLWPVCGIIEYLCNLGALRRDVVQLYALPLRVVGLDGSPVRAVAVED